MTTKKYSSKSKFVCFTRIFTPSGSNGWRCCRSLFRRFTHKYCNENPMITPLISEFCDISPPDFCQFLLVCSAIPKVQVFTSQKERSVIFNHLFHITRTWVYTLHKARLKILGRWNTIWISYSLSHITNIPGTMSKFCGSM